jgi:septal ring-binding cell division protein DamX
MNQNGGSRTDTLVKLVLLFITSLFSFSVGTFVGKQFTEKDRTLASQEMEFQTEEGTSVETATIEDVVIDENMEAQEKIAEADLDQLDLDTLKAEMEKESKAAASNTKQNIQASANVDSKIKEIVQKAADRVMENQAPLEKVKEAPRGPAAFPNVVAGSTIGKYTIQIASYQNQVEAEKFAQKLKDQGLAAFYLEANVNGKMWYRVSIGTYPDLETAKEQKEFVQKQANIPSAIIQKITR